MGFNHYCLDYTKKVCFHEVFKVSIFIISRSIIIFPLQQYSFSFCFVRQILDNQNI